MTPEREAEIRAVLNGDLSVDMDDALIVMSMAADDLLNEVDRLRDLSVDIETTATGQRCTVKLTGITLFDGVSLEATLTTEAHDRRVAAKALREAADDMDDTDDPDAIHVNNGDIDKWLCVRADRIEREAGESDD